MSGFLKFPIAATVLAAALVFTNCNNSEVISPQEVSAEIAPASRTPNFIPFAKDQKGSFHRIRTATGLVTQAAGGELELDYDGDFELEAELEVPANSISEDAVLTMSIDDENFFGDFTFEPHGITFSVPARLSFEADGLDLSGIDPATVKVYYDNTETGEWEEMACDNIIVRIDDGEVEVENALLPHFSRYGIASN